MSNSVLYEREGVIGKINSNDSLIEFLSLIDQDIMEFLKKFYKNSIE